MYIAHHVIEFARLQLSFDVNVQIVSSRTSYLVVYEDIATFPYMQNFSPRDIIKYISSKNSFSHLKCKIVD